MGKKIRKNFLLPEDLSIWMESYLDKHKMTMTQIIVNHFMEIKRLEEKGHAEQI